MTFLHLLLGLKFTIIIQYIPLPCLRKGNVYVCYIPCCYNATNTGTYIFNLYDYFQHRNDYWKQIKNGRGFLCIPRDLKLLSSLLLRSTSTAADSLNDLVYMSKETFRIYFRQFCIEFMYIYGGRFFNRFTCSSELKDIVDSCPKITFPECIGAVCCIKYVWKNFPATIKGQYLNI